MFRIRLMRVTAIPVSQHVGVETGCTAEISGSGYHTFQLLIHCCKCYMRINHEAEIQKVFILHLLQLAEQHTN